MKKAVKYIYIPLAWTIVIQVLFCLPGSSLPSAPVFAIPNFDKFVHIIFMSGFVWLWCRYFFHLGWSFKRLKRVFFLIYCIAAINGILVEYIQYYYIPNRSFDASDIIADLIGASLAYGIANLAYLKEADSTPSV